jgi:bifunctional ADP-heptose synthase (sugar kinase/adenylyltransferase)
MLKELNEFIEIVKNWNVLVIGETIVDEFIPVVYEGNSMKSNCPVLRLEGETQIQQGGATAIANHIKDFVANVDIVTNNDRTIVKTRYYDPFDNKKHVEINKFDKKNYGNSSLPDLAQYDVIIMADFGHGFCDSFEVNKPFCLMTQTNSNNFGFNRISKWKNFKKLMSCIDLREASLQMNKRYNQANEEMLINLFNYELNSNYLFVTTGSKGSYFTDGKNCLNQPVFKTNIVDTIGAGDTFFAFASLISNIQQKERFLFIPGLAASLSTTWMCNEYSINQSNILKHANQYLQPNI